MTETDYRLTNGDSNNDSNYTSCMGIHLPTNDSFWMSTSDGQIIKSDGSLSKKLDSSAPAEEADTSQEKRSSLASISSHNDVPTFLDHILFLQAYRNYFREKEHFNFLASHSSMGFIIMSVRYELITIPIPADTLNGGSNSYEYYKIYILLRTASKSYFQVIDPSDKKHCSSKENISSGDDNGEDNDNIINQLRISSASSTGSQTSEQPITNPVILAKKILPSLEVEGFCSLSFPMASQLIVSFDEFSMQTRFKFGVIYQRVGQYTEEELLSNVYHSAEFEHFLEIIGDRVNLQEFKDYRGGLELGHSNEKEAANDESVYTKFSWPQQSSPDAISETEMPETAEIMFHVSTLLPYSSTDKQQVARKRHIGNDIASLVFQEPGAVFNPEKITSNFLHVYIIVQPIYNNLAESTNEASAEDSNTSSVRYRVITVSRKDVPPFQPETHAELFDKTTLKQFLLMKLINAEIASYQATTFATLQFRTRRELFDTLARDLYSQICAMFEVGAGLCSPFSSIFRSSVKQSPNNSPCKDQGFMESHKRSGSFLKSLKKTFRRQANQSQEAVSATTSLTSETPDFDFGFSFHRDQHSLKAEKSRDDEQSDVRKMLALQNLPLSPRPPRCLQTSTAAANTKNH